MEGTKPINEKLLLQHLYEGNQQAFEQIFNQYYQQLCSFAFQFLKEDLGAEEIVQDVFCAIWEKRSTQQIDSLKSYLYQAVRNKCLNAIKHIEVREEYKQQNKYQLDLEENSEEENDSNELTQNLKTTIDAMPEMRKKVFLMSKYDGLKYNEIASALGISVKTVENHMGKALAFLRDEMQRYITPLIALIHFFIK